MIGEPNTISVEEDRIMEDDEIIEKAVELLEKSVEEIENLYGKDTDLTNEIRGFLNKQLGRCEDAERFPCKVGDVLYVLVDMDENGKYTRWKGDIVKSFYLNRDNERMIEFTWVWHDIPLSEVGKSVFLTKEEAEQALAKM